VVLVDTSVWIEFFRQPSKFDLQAVVDLEEIVTCPPVLQEVLQGFDNQRSFLVAREAMLAFPVVEERLPLQAYLEAADNSLTLLHKDRDFDALARVAPLSVLGSEL